MEKLSQRTNKSIEEEGVCLELKKIIDFMNTIQTVECRAAILDVLMDWLKEEGIANYRYYSLKKQITSGRFRQKYNENTATAFLEFDRIFSQISQNELAQPYMFEGTNALFDYAIFPVFGPYMRDGVFILQSPLICTHQINLELHLINVVLQRTHMAILKIETREDQENLGFSMREIDVLAGVSSGLSNQEIAELLGISVHTVNGYLRRIMLKLGTQDKFNTGLIGLSMPAIISRSRKLIPRVLHTA